MGPLNRPRQRAHRSHALAREVVALALAELLLLRGLEASETYNSLPAASPLAGTSKLEAHTRATRTVAEKRLNHPPFPFPPNQCLSISAVTSTSHSSHVHVFTAGSRHSLSCSLRQLAEMPSLAGPKSRAQLASFTRLDDGAFCRVISASLWAPPTPSKQATPGQPAAPKQVVQLALRVVSWHLLCHWPLASLFSFSLASPNTCSSHCAGQAHTHGHGHGAIWLAGREIYTRRASLAKKCPACR